MFGGNFLLGLDIGTSVVRAVVVEQRRERPIIRAAFSEPSQGVKKGVIDDLAEASSAVNHILSEVRRVERRALKNAYINIGTYQVRSQASRGIVAVSRADSEIYDEDIQRANRAAQAVQMPPNRTVVHYVTREYIVDGVGDIVDPIGLSGSRLEVNGLLIDAFAPHVKSVVRLVELAGGHMSGLVLNPLAAARSVVTKNQKDLGVAVIDLGGGTTSVAVYHEGKLLHVGAFPVGAANITNDIGIRLKIPVVAAEQLKLRYGYAVGREVSVKESIELEKFAPEAKGAVSRRLVAETIEARLAEMLELVNNELKLTGANGQLAGGAVLVGGGAKLPGLTELARQELKMTAQVGLPLADEWEAAAEGRNDLFEDPEHAPVLGLALWGAEHQGWLTTRNGSLAKKLIGYFTP